MTFIPMHPHLPAGRQEHQIARNIWVIITYGGMKIAYNMNSWVATRKINKMNRIINNSNLYLS